MNDALQKAKLLRDLTNSYSYKLTLGQFLENKRKGAYQSLINAEHSDPELPRYLMELKVIEHIFAYIDASVSEVNRELAKQQKVENG